jgi:hypothetical protein
MFNRNLPCLGALITQVTAVNSGTRVNALLVANLRLAD